MRYVALLRAVNVGGTAKLPKLTPALLDKAAGAPVTARNRRAVTRLQEMVSD